MYSFKKLLTLGISVFGLTSCTSILKPYELGKKAGIYSPACRISSPPSHACIPLDKALERARNLQAAYLKTAGNDELARNITGSGITLATTYALILGISDGIGPANASDQIIALGGGIASANAITSIFTSPTRQKVFIAGASALTCVRQAATPFELDHRSLVKLSTYLDPITPASSLEHSIIIVDSFIEELSRLSAAATTVAAVSGIAADKATATAASSGKAADKAAAVAAVSKNAADIAVAADLQSYVSGIRQEISVARASLGRGYATYQELTRTAPARLLRQLGAIDAAVATQLQETTVDLNAIQQVASNLQSSAANIAPQFSSVSSTPANSTIMTALTIGGLGIMGMGVTPLSISLSGTPLYSSDYFIALSVMRAGTSFINLRADDIERRIKGVNQSFEACDFQPVDLGIRLQADKIQIKQGQSGSFIVEEGQAPFVAEVVGNVSGLSVDFTPAFGNRGVITVDASVAKKDYQITIYDRTLKPVSLTATVN